MEPPGRRRPPRRLVLEAVKAGFTAIDTANQLIHYDETLVGEALLRLREEGVARDGIVPPIQVHTRQRTGPPHAL